MVALIHASVAGAVGVGCVGSIFLGMINTLNVSWLFCQRWGNVSIDKMDAGSAIV